MALPIFPVPQTQPAVRNPGMAQPSGPSPPLLEELMEEILLRFPPDEPASLFRACLVCKPWCRLISGARFRRRYRGFHRTPPMLGFLCGRIPSDEVYISGFVPTSVFCPPLIERWCCRLLDARHGRVLLHKLNLVIWDPITHEQKEIPMPMPNPMPSTRTWNAAVVCAASAIAGACDHLDCHRGAFLVVFVVSCPRETLIWTYSSEAGSWSDPIFSQQDQYVSVYDNSMLVGNALYFGVHGRQRILKYDLESHKMSVVGLPPTSSHGQPFSMCPFVLTNTEDGRLRLATIHESKLYMWSTKHGPEEDAAWTCVSVSELEMLLCSNGILTKPLLVGFMDRFGVCFLRAGDLLFTVDLNTHKVKKVYEGRRIYKVIPYMRFCTPALEGGLRVEGPSAGVSSE